MLKPDMHNENEWLFFLHLYLSITMESEFG